MQNQQHFYKANGQTFYALLDSLAQSFMFLFYPKTSGTSAVQVKEHQLSNLKILVYFCAYWQAKMEIWQLSTNSQFFGTYGKFPCKMLFMFVYIQNFASIPVSR